MPLAELVYTIDVDGRPTVTFQARQLREACELCKEEWFRSDLADITSGGSPLYNQASKLKARIATDNESSVYRQMAQAANNYDEVVFAYLVEIDEICE
jgi:hypothetical protein